MLKDNIIPGNQTIQGVMCFNHCIKSVGHEKSKDEPLPLTLNAEIPSTLALYVTNQIQRINLSES